MQNFKKTDAARKTIRYGCGALIINEQHQVLLMQRSAGSRNDVGLWSQPGGAIDLAPDERVHEDAVVAAIHREIREELGITITTKRFLSTTGHQDEHHHWISFSYLAAINTGTPVLLEPHKHSALKWFDLHDLPHDLNQVTQESIFALCATLTFN